MVKAKDIASLIEGFAPLAYQEKWDNSGFCIGSPEQIVSGAVFALDCTIQVVNEAIEKGVNMIITHHPLIFEGLKKISPDDETGAIVFKAIENGVVIYAAHTNADKVPGGVSGLMATKLGMVNVEILEQDPSVSEPVGLGVIGDLRNPVDPYAFAGYVKSSFKVGCVRASEAIKGSISRVAMCGGSGKSLIKRAKDAGADAYISGDIPYHEFFREDDFMILDIGHFESEIDIVELLFLLVKKKMPNFAVYIANSSKNPIYYF